MVNVRGSIQAKREAKRKLEEIKQRKGETLDVDIYFDSKRVAKYGREISPGLLLRLSTLDPAKISFVEYPNGPPPESETAEDE